MTWLRVKFGNLNSVFQISKQIFSHNVWWKLIVITGMQFKKTYTVFSFDYNECFIFLLCFPSCLSFWSLELLFCFYIAWWWFWCYNLEKSSTYNGQYLLVLISKWIYIRKCLQPPSTMAGLEKDGEPVYLSHSPPLTHKVTQFPNATFPIKLNTRFSTFRKIAFTIKPSTWWYYVDDWKNH